MTVNLGYRLSFRKRVFSFKPELETPVGQGLVGFRWVPKDCSVSAKVHEEPRRTSDSCINAVIISDLDGFLWEGNGMYFHLVL